MNDSQKEPASKFQLRNVKAWYGDNEVLHGVDADIPEHSVTAIIGPSGCGKSTLLRSLNRMHELVDGARVDGQVSMDGVDIYGPKVDPVLLRRQVGMVFQKPNPFPSMSVRENVLAGARLTGTYDPSRADAIVQRALTQAALWDEVKDRLEAPGVSLSGGQQQRLCIARSLAVEPTVLLMDEPCSALDPIATTRVENLVHTLKQDYTIVIVTHNMQQAARVSDRTAFMLSGDLIEFSDTIQLFKSPSDPRTEDYITGKFG